MTLNIHYKGVSLDDISGLNARLDKAVEDNEKVSSQTCETIRNSNFVLNKLLLNHNKQH